MKFKIDEERIKKAKDEKEKNKIERMEFVKFWAKYVKKHKDKEWSKQQNIIINSQLP